MTNYSDISIQFKFVHGTSALSTLIFSMGVQNISFTIFIAEKWHHV